MKAGCHTNGVGRETVREAMTHLEEQGILALSGQGQRRRIVMCIISLTMKKIRLRIFIYEKQDRGRINLTSLLAELLENGIDAEFTSKSLKDLNMQVERVARYVKQNPADAWILIAASRQVIAWFADQLV